MEEAKHLILYYFNLIYQKATGEHLSSDCQAEVQCIIDDIQAYVDYRVKEEVQKALQEISKYKEAGNQ